MVVTRCNKCCRYSDKNNNQGKEEMLPFYEHPMESKILNDTVAFIKSIAKERKRNEEWAVESVTKSLSITNEEAFSKGVVEIIAKDDQELLDKLDGRSVEAVLPRGR